MNFLRKIFQIRDTSRDTEFCSLCYQGTAKEVKEALASLGSVKATHDNAPAIFYAVHSPNRAEILKLLISAGANVNSTHPERGTPLIAASVVDSNVDIINILLRAGANPNAVMKLTARENYKTKVILQTPLVVAMQNSMTNNLEALLEGKANPNQRLHDRTTPLMFAAAMNLPDVIDALGIYGADFSARDNKGFTALDTAILLGKHEAVEILQEWGACSNMIR